MSSLDEKILKNLHDSDHNTRVQSSNGKKEDQSNKNKRVKLRKQQMEEVPVVQFLEKNDSNSDVSEKEGCDFNQELKNISSGENEKERTELKTIDEICLPRQENNLNELAEVIDDNTANKPQLDSCVKPLIESCCGDDFDNLEHIQQQLNEKKVLIRDRNSPVAKDNTDSANASGENTFCIQHSSLSKICDTNNSNNFLIVSNEKVDNGSAKAIIDEKLISSKSPPHVESCVPNVKSSDSMINDSNTSNLRTPLPTESLSLQTDEKQNINSRSAIWQNPHTYEDNAVNGTNCFERVEIKENQFLETSKSEVTGFQHEYNRLQNQDILTKIKTEEEDHMRTTKNQQDHQLLNQQVFTNTQHQEQDYRNHANTQHGQHQVSYGMIFNEMPQRPQQQPPHPHQYSHEQFYEMRLQQQQHPSLLTHHQQNLNLQDALQDEQLMAYLHPRQQPNRTQHDTYAELVMDEFHDEGNANASANLYKLQLSPAAKHENQDDGYETSAGDVLTPNSHSSSTQSGTPQSVPGSQHAPPTSTLAIQNITQPQHHLQHQHQPQRQMQAPAPASNLMNSFSPGATPCVNEDLYKFHDEPNNVSSEPKDDHNFCMSLEHQLINNTTANNLISHQMPEAALGKPPQKRRGRKKKMPEGIEANDTTSDNPLASTGVIKVKERKKHDRFNGMSEEEVIKRTLPDHLCHNLDIVIVGINPGLFAAYKGHHYAGPGNHFWKCLYLSGLTQEQMSAEEDFKLIKYGIGFTNMVERATKGSADLTRKEIKEGSRILLEKLRTFQPKIAVFNGKLIFEVFSGKKDFHFGRQPDCVEGTNTFVWVMPSSSARCAQLPRAADKVPFYAALKKFRDFLNGLVPHIDEAECIFTDQRIREMCEQEQARNLAQTQHSTSGSASVTQQNEQANGFSLFASSDGSQINSGNLNPTENTNSGPGPPSMSESRGRYLGSPANFQQQPEKKKRGRPKKLKLQEIIDPNTGERIQISNQHQSLNDYSNILNLSMVGAETPKKKRGRPKKVKMLATNNGSEDGLNTVSTPTHNQQQHSLFNNSPQNVNVQQLSSYNSPISPSIHSSSTFNNMVVVGTPPRNSNEMPTDSDVINSNKHQHIHVPSVTSPPPSLPPGSPNICAVDFEPPSTAVNEHNSTEHELAKALQHQVQRNNTFQQWMPTTSQQQFNYSPDEHQQHQQHQYQRDHDLTMQLQQQQQSSPHASWASTNHQSYEATNENNQRQPQQQHHHYIINTGHQNQQQQQHTLMHQQTVEQQQQQQQATDVAAKSLSGLESLVDQIPTIAESEAAAAAAVESRLQALQRDSTPVSLGELQAETVYEARSMTEVTGSESRNSNSSNGGSNTPQHYAVNAPSSCSSPTINHHLFSSSNNMQRHHSQTSSAASSPRPHTQQQYTGATANFTDHSAGGGDMLVAAAQTPPMNNTSSTVTTNSTTSATTSHLFSNFSVSHLAASSCNSNSNNNNSKSVNDWSPSVASGASSNGSSYHHSNLMAAAAIQLTTSPHHQMYLDHHTTLHPHHAAAHLHNSPHQHHMQVNSYYSSAAQTHHHHPGMAAVTAYGSPSGSAQHAHHPHAHNASPDYGTYGASPAHMIHMPSPNYPPYGYGTPPPPTGTVTAQSNYSSWNHHHHHSHHHPSTVPTHHSHHLSMFERLKPSDIGSYTGF